MNIGELYREFRTRAESSANKAFSSDTADLPDLSDCEIGKIIESYGPGYTDGFRKGMLEGFLRLWNLAYQAGNKSGYHTGYYRAMQEISAILFAEKIKQDLKR